MLSPAMLCCAVLIWYCLSVHSQECLHPDHTCDELVALPPLPTDLYTGGVALAQQLLPAPADARLLRAALEEGLTQVSLHRHSAAHTLLLYQTCMSFLAIIYPQHQVSACGGGGGDVCVHVCVWGGGEGWKGMMGVGEGDISMLTTSDMVLDVAICFKSVLGGKGRDAVCVCVC